MTKNNPEWIFGYGSLIWRPNFPAIEARAGWVHGWTRRFYQGSADHRGTDEFPGRVVTLLPELNAKTWGMAYRPEPEYAQSILAQLDHREKHGYARHEVIVCPQDAKPFNALVYVATQDNPHFLGPAPLLQMAQRIIDAHGPSGSNREYLFELERALRLKGIDDEHIFTLAEAVRALL